MILVTRKYVLLLYFELVTRKFCFCLLFRLSVHAGVCIWASQCSSNTTCSLKKNYDILKIQISKKLRYGVIFFWSQPEQKCWAWAWPMTRKQEQVKRRVSKAWTEGSVAPGRLFLDKKQRWTVVMRINNWSHKMSIKKLYKITKITPLSNPVANKMVIAWIFRFF